MGVVAAAVVHRGEQGAASIDKPAGNIYTKNTERNHLKESNVHT